MNADELAESRQRNIYSGSVCDEVGSASDGSGFFGAGATGAIGAAAGCPAAMLGALTMLGGCDATGALAPGSSEVVPAHAASSQVAAARPTAVRSRPDISISYGAGDVRRAALACSLARAT